MKKSAFLSVICFNGNIDGAINLVEDRVKVLQTPWINNVFVILWSHYDSFISFQIVVRPLIPFFCCSRSLARHFMIYHCLFSILFRRFFFIRNNSMNMKSCWHDISQYLLTQRSTKIVLPSWAGVMRTMNGLQKYSHHFHISVRIKWMFNVTSEHRC